MKDIPYSRTKQYRREQYIKNKDEIKRRSKAYYRRHKSEIRAKQKEYATRIRKLINAVVAKEALVN